MIEDCPAPVGDVESFKLGLLLVNVTARPLGGATPFSVMVADVSRSCPTVAFPATIPTGLTVTKTEFAGAPATSGALNPVGTPAVTVVEPLIVELAVNCATALSLPAVNLIGDSTMVPTFVAELVTGTLMVAPRRIC
jgi:hypothetical protein